MKALLTLATASVVVAGSLGLAAIASPATEPTPAAFPVLSDGTTYAIDPTHSQVLFRIKHLGVSYNYGRFNDVSGTVVIDEDRASKSSIEVVVKADSVDTNNGNRDNHIKSPDFLSAKEFPTITFKSKKVTQKGNTWKVTGDLTLHGVTNEIEVEVEHVGTGTGPRGGTLTGFETVFEIDPTDYEIRWIAEHPDMLGPEIRMIIAIEAAKQG
ncbi:MAG: YceI family protein [Planctomycetota bacterium]|nr:YceI family protein [Planctomycetota bacterium]